MSRRAAKAVQTFHPLAIAKSLERQNEALFGLLAAVQNVLTFNYTSPVMRNLKQAHDECRAAFYSQEDEDA